MKDRKRLNLLPEILPAPTTSVPGLARERTLDRMRKLIAASAAAATLHGCRPGYVYMPTDPPPPPPECTMFPMVVAALWHEENGHPIIAATISLPPGYSIAMDDGYHDGQIVRTQLSEDRRVAALRIAAPPNDETRLLVPIYMRASGLSCGTIIRRLFILLPITRPGIGTLLEAFVQ